VTSFVRRSVSTSRPVPSDLLRHRRSAMSTLSLAVEAARGARGARGGGTSEGGGRGTPFSLRPLRFFLSFLPSLLPPPLSLSLSLSLSGSLWLSRSLALSLALSLCPLSPARNPLPSIRPVRPPAPLPATLAPTPPSHRPSRESAFDRPEFFSTLESGALRAISRLVAGWSSPRKTPRKIVRSIYLRSSGPKRTTRREGRVRDEKDEDERGIEGEREREREREGKSQRYSRV